MIKRCLCVLGLLLQANLFPLDLEISLSLEYLNQYAYWDHSLRNSYDASVIPIDDQWNFQRDILDPYQIINYPINRIYIEIHPQNSINRGSILFLERLNHTFAGERALKINTYTSQWMQMDASSSEKEVFFQLLTQMDQVLPFERIEIPYAIYGEQNLQNSQMWQDFQRWMHDNDKELTLNVKGDEILTEIPPHRISLSYYDFSGKHCNLTTMKELFYFQSQQGLEWDKVVLTIPLYGRNFQSDSAEYWYDSKDYWEIMDLLPHGEDPNIREEYYYNSSDLLEEKILFAQEWELSSIRIDNWEKDSSTLESLLQKALELIP